jgi:hypothetical protein
LAKHEKTSIKSIRIYENERKQKIKKSACIGLGNRCSIHLSYGGANHAENTPAGANGKPNAISLCHPAPFL